MLKVGLSFLLLLAAAQCAEYSTEIFEDIFQIVTKSPLAVLDQCPQIDTTLIEYHLYNSHSKDVPIILTNETWNQVDLDLETKIIVHGWLDCSNTSYILDMKNAYLARGYYNVIIVGWKTFANVQYAHAYCNVPQVGKDVGNFIYDINVLLNKTHLIGFGLGAHVSGFAGQRIQSVYDGLKVGRITALDASGPLYESRRIPGALADGARLSSDDAHFVDAIHTNGLIFGYQDSFGTVDFFVNGGAFQLACPILSIPRAVNDVRDILDGLTCSHHRAHEYFIESINSDKFKATRSGLCILNCSSLKAVMGEDCPKTVRGNYAITTNSRPPYARTGLFSK